MDVPTTETEESTITTNTNIPQTSSYCDVYDCDSIDSINRLADSLAIYTMPAIFALGVFGNMATIIVLRRINRDFFGLARQLKHAPCHVVAAVVIAILGSRAWDHGFGVPVESGSISTAHQNRFDLLALRLVSSGEPDKQMRCTKVLLDGIGIKMFDRSSLGIGQIGFVVPMKKIL